MVGGIGNMNRLRDRFHLDVASHYGLSRSESNRLALSDKQAIEQQVLARLKGDAAMQSSVWACVRNAIHNDPLPYAQMLSISMPFAKQPIVMH